MEQRFAGRLGMVRPATLRDDGEAPGHDRPGRVIGRREAVDQLHPCPEASGASAGRMRPAGAGSRTGRDRQRGQAPHPGLKPPQQMSASVAAAWPSCGPQPDTVHEVEAEIGVSAKRELIVVVGRRGEAMPISAGSACRGDELRARMASIASW